MKNTNIKQTIKNGYNKFNKHEFHNIEVIFITITTAIVSLYIGTKLNKQSKIENDKYINEIIENYNYILDNYYSDVDKDKLVKGSIDGMVASLDDDYSEYISKDENSAFYINLNGTYEGIGVEIYNNEKNDIVVLGVISDSPAAKAGIKTGDIIKKIDDKELTNTDKSELTKYVQTNKHESYNLIIVRDSQEQNITIKREMITIKSVATKTFEKNGKKIGYIYMSVFAKATSEQFKEAVNKLEKEGIDALIVDVRNNSGGHLETAISVISNFVDSSNIIYQIKQGDKITKYKSIGEVTKKYPIAVIQNSQSASASELFSSALKETYGATIIGETSYGKGSVQEMIKLKNGDSYKFTTKLWLTAKGNSINKKGVKPDIEVNLSDEYKNNPSDDTDNQLQTALEVVSK